MSIKVHDFKYIPGENDAEYIKLLEEALERQRTITAKAIAKIKELSKDVDPEEVGAVLDFCKEQGLGNLVGLLNAIATDRIIVLPCAVGSKFYMIEKYCDSRNESGEMTVHSMSDCEYWCDKDCCDAERRVTEYSFGNTMNILSAINRIGKTVFLTREEAEAALNERDFL